MCVSAHYSPLIPSNAVWSLEAGTLISCFFCFTNSSRRPGERTSVLEAEISRKWQEKSKTETQEGSFHRVYRKPRKRVSPDWHGAGRCGLLSVWNTNDPGERNVPSLGSRWEPVQGPRRRVGSLRTALTSGRPQAIPDRTTSPPRPECPDLP